MNKVCRIRRKALVPKRNNCCREKSSEVFPAKPVILSKLLLWLDPGLAERREAVTLGLDEGVENVAGLMEIADHGITGERLDRLLAAALGSGVDGQFVGIDLG